MCNVYLHRLDRAWDEREHWVLVRFADDVLVMCKSRRQAEAALTRLRDLLAELGLAPKEAKTRIVRVPRAQRERLGCRQETSIDVLLRGR